MDQILIANLSPEVTARLRRRAELSGRTLEGEVRALLTSAAEPLTSALTNEPCSVAISRRVHEIGLTEEEWRYLDRSLRAARHSRSDSLHRWIDFEGPEWDFMGPNE